MLIHCSAKTKMTFALEGPHWAKCSLFDELSRRYLISHDVASVFIDFSKAIDSVNQEIMFQILALYSYVIIDAIKILYTDHSSAIILSSDGEIAAFDICAGIV